MNSKGLSTGVVLFSLMTCGYIGQRNLVDCFTDTPAPEQCRDEPFGLGLFPQPPAMPADLHLPDAQAERLRKIIDVEMRPFTKHPALVARAQQIVRQNGSGADQLAKGREIGQQLVSRGLPRLPAARLDRWNELRIAVSQRSEKVCTAFWNGNLDGPMLYAALAQLPDADLRDWMRISAQAGILELEAKGAPVQIDKQAVPEALEAIRRTLDPEAQSRLQAGVEAGTAADDVTACQALRLLLTGARSLDAPLRERFLRALASS